MNGIINYRGYEIVAQHNKKIVARIKNNRHVSANPGWMDAHLEYEPSINFVFKNYDTMVEFMDANPR